MDGALPGRTSEQDQGGSVRSRRGSTASGAAAAQALAVSRGHGSAGRGGAVVLHGLVSGRQNDRRVLALCIGAVAHLGQGISGCRVASLRERILELDFAVDSLQRGNVTDRGLVGAGSRAGLDLGGKDPTKMSQGRRCSRGSRGAARETVK